MSDKLRPLLLNASTRELLAKFTKSRQWIGSVSSVRRSRRSCFTENTPLLPRARPLTPFSSHFPYVFFFLPYSIKQKTLKFGTAYAASECVKVFEGRFFGGRKLSCHFWDGVTNYTVKHEDEKEEVIHAYLYTCDTW